MARVTEKFNELNRKYTDPRTRCYLTPKRIVKSWGEVVNADALLREKEPQVSLRACDACLMINGREKRNAAVLIDFGIEFPGSLRIFINSSSKAGKQVYGKLLVRFGESANEALTPIGERGTTNDHATREFILDIELASANETPESGFRFAYIELLGDDSKAVIEKIFGVFHYLNLDYKGSFECNDELLNRIWNVSAYTAHVCMQEYIWDGIKRDRLVWIGDMHPEITTMLAVFGDTDVIERSLDFVRDETPDGSWMNNISTYSLWWVLIHADLYRTTGSKGYLSEQRDKLCDILSRVSDCVRDDGGENMPPRTLLDWPNEANAEAKHAGIHAMLKMTLEKGAAMLDEIGEHELCKKCLNTVEKMKKHIPDPNGSKQAAAMLALSGLGDAKRLNDEVISVDGAKGFSTFFSYYLLSAKAIAGDHIGALDAIREYYGAMIKMGATTFWEDFDLDWVENSSPIDELTPEGMNDIHGDFGDYCYKNFRHSLCHSWSSGPCPYMSHYVLGIRPIDADTYIVKPELGDLLWARGTYPTKHGVISVSAGRTDDGLRVEYDAPVGIKVITN